MASANALIKEHYDKNGNLNITAEDLAARMVDAHGQKRQEGALPVATTALSNWRRKIGACCPPASPPPPCVRQARLELSGGSTPDLLSPPPPPCRVPVQWHVWFTNCCLLKWPSP